MGRWEIEYHYIVLFNLFFTLDEYVQNDVEISFVHKCNDVEINEPQKIQTILHLQLELKKRRIMIDIIIFCEITSLIYYVTSNYIIFYFSLLTSISTNDIKLKFLLFTISRSKTRTNSVVKFYDCSNFNRKNGRTCPYNTSKVVHSPSNIHSLFLCKCTLLGNGRYKSNCKHPLRS